MTKQTQLFALLKRDASAGESVQKYVTELVGKGNKAEVLATVVNINEVKDATARRNLGNKLRMRLRRACIGLKMPKVWGFRKTKEGNVEVTETDAPKAVTPESPEAAAAKAKADEARLDAALKIVVDNITNPKVSATLSAALIANAPALPTGRPQQAPAQAEAH